MEVDRKIMEVNIVTSERHRALALNASTQRIVADITRKYELLKSNVDRHTVLGAVIEEQRQERIALSALQQENALLKSTTAHLRAQVTLGAQAMLELSAIREQQLQNHTLVLGSMDLCEGIPRRNGQLVPLVYQGEEEMEIPITDTINLYDKFAIGAKSRTMRLHHGCALNSADTAAAVRRMNIHSRKADLIAKGLDVSGPGQYSIVVGRHLRGLAKIRASYMPFGEITLEMFVEEGIRIPNGTIHMYRALNRRILFAFYGEVIHDDSVICNVEMRCRSW
jgi:hypothetical protein